MENLCAVSMLLLLMKNLNCWACKLQKVCTIFNLLNFVSQFTDEFLHSAWQMSLLLLLKASRLYLRVPLVSEKMHKGIVEYMLNCNFCDSSTRNAFKKLFFVLPRSNNSFSIKYQAWFMNVRNCSNFLGFPPFSSKHIQEVHFNTFHKNILF